MVLVVLGVSLPRQVVVFGEVAVSAVVVLEVVVACRLVMAKRRDGAGWRAALRNVEQLVPERVRRVMAFDLKGIVSLVLLVARRRYGVPPGAVGMSYRAGRS